MPPSSKQQWIVLGATVLTLALGAGFRFFPNGGGESWFWPVAVLLGLVWGAIAAGMLRRSSR